MMQVPLAHHRPLTKAPSILCEVNVMSSNYGAQLPGRKIHERRPLPMFGIRMLFIFRLECLRKGKGVVFEGYKRWRMEVLKLGGCTKASLGWSFQFLKEKMVHLLWFHNFRNGELAKMGDGFGWPEQGTLLWKLKLGMALMALDNLKSLQVSRRGLLMSTSFSDWYVFLACSISIYTCYYI